MSAKTRNQVLNAKLAQHMLAKAKGFTLIELLVVIVIVGILSAVAVPTFLNQVRRSRTAEAQAALSEVGRGSEAFRLDNGTYPADFAGIAATATNTRYMEDAFTAKAPNYQDPTITAGASSNSGIAWQTIADSTANPAYVNGADVALTCILGLGDQTAATTVDTGCNL